VISSTGKISILAIGSELLDGRVLDTNSRFSAEILSNHGIVVDQILSCDDDLSAIKAALGFLLNSVDVVICSGGLGPTNDDLTREAIAEFAAAPLLQDQAILEALEQRYRARNRPFDRSNVKQSLIPIGAEILSNPIGTAPGFAVNLASKLLIALPGVPREFETMLVGRSKELIVAKFPNLPSLNTHTFKTFGLPEASVGSRVSSCGLPPEIAVSYRASFPEVEVKLKSRSDLCDAIQKVRVALEPQHIFSEDPNESYPQAVLASASAAGLEFSLIDCVTGGVLSQLMAEADPEAKSLKSSVLVSTSDPPIDLLSKFGADCRVILAVQNLSEHEYRVVIEAGTRRSTKMISAKFDPGFLQRYLAFCVLRELNHFVLAI